MIIVTGAAGFIGSNMVGKLNREGFRDIILVDRFDTADKEENYSDKQFTDKIDRELFFSWLDENHRFVQIIIHMGARTDTAEFDTKVFDELNLEYSRKIWRRCVQYGLPLIYASSAATYGSGKYGYDDTHEIVDQLKPLNPYGESKNEFDKWAIKQELQPFFWAGLKFFNVYGPNEYHKGRMASVVYHAFRQIQMTGTLKLFRSHRHDYADGEQKRDFIYVKDAVNVIHFLMQTRKESGIFNVGTGKARTFLSLASAVFDALGLSPDIEFIDTPADIRDTYQYFTEAKMEKLKSIGYKEGFINLEEGIFDYIKNYLLPGKYY